MEQNDRGDQDHQVKDILLLTHFTHHLRHGILPPSLSHRSYPQAGRPFFPFLFPPLRGFYPHGGAWSDIRWRKLKVLWDRARQSSGLCRPPSQNLCDLLFFLRHTLASQRWVLTKNIIMTTWHLWLMSTGIRWLSSSAAVWSSRLPSSTTSV